MNQSYNYYPRQNPIQQQATVMRQPYLNGRPVSSLEEARATPIDFDGSVFYFPDLANRRIYTKQINLDGTATLNMYELKEIPVADTSTNNYITREEFEAVIGQLQAAFQAPQTAPPQKPEVMSF